MPDLARIQDKALYVEYQHYMQHHMGILRPEPGCQTCLALRALLEACTSTSPAPLGA